MSIFSNILNKIFPQNHPATTGSAATAPPAATGSPSAAAAPSTPSTAAASNVQPPVTPMPEVDIEVVLAKMQESSGQQLNWKTSIVDLLKVLGLDSSPEARKELARELNYTGSTDDSAGMNVWLHRAVMQKLAENGGKVPDDLKH
jgi:hypothetical protein